MGSLRLLPGEKEELHLHPAASSFMARKAWAAGFALWGGLLWTVFHSAWWVGHRPSDWTAAWTWLWGTDTAAYLWTVAGLTLGGAAASLPRGPWTKAWIGLACGAAVAILAALFADPSNADGTTATPGATEATGTTDVLAILTMLLALPALAWTEVRRLATSYHVTNLRLVVRTAAPRRTERSVLYSELVDLDARRSPWPDTGTLIPVTARSRSPGHGAVAAAVPEAASEPLVMPGVRPFGRVRALVEALARRATASELSKSQEGLDGQVAEALAALHRR